ncbi:MAG: gamma-glutamyl-gamma-aminobutyrate hydrolase family protein [Methanomicrobiales archaeon]|nr:gamma-glutamyl-gamma-aminobutyrate hydrolase family protein [Methanomicrobiales archaeon]
MILVLDLSYRPGSLSADEFVAPVECIVREEGQTPQIRHYTGVAREDLEAADGAILCGTALKDTGYLDGLESFGWLTSFPHPVLGICAGMQAIARIFGGTVQEGVSIGMAEVEVTGEDPLFAGRNRFTAYELHGLSVVPPASFRVLAVSPSGVQAIRHREMPVYGVLFHPEVRNEWLVRRFLSLCRQKGSGHNRRDEEGKRGI